MKFNYRYHGASAASSNAKTSQMNFTPDTLRKPTFFVAELAQHINFRESMSALHHVVVSDLRLQPKNREDYFTWLKSEETNMLADLASQSVGINEEVQALRKELTTIRTEKQKVMQPFYKSQDKYFQYLYKNDYSAWFVLDPVITVHPDSVFFECFSQDESSYGKLSCKLSAFKNVQEFACGTTNIDYSADLYNEFQKIRDYKTTMFNIDPSGFDVTTTNEESFFEPKIDLPDSWVRGFLQVSSAMTLPSARFSLHPMDMHNFLFVLKQKKERVGPRSIRFELTPDKPVVAVFEPWNRRIECKRSIYKGKEAKEIRIWGRRRLMLLERLIPITKAFHVHLAGSGLPSFFEADMGDMTFTLGLSGWTANDWSKVSNFDLMAPRGEVDSMTCERVFIELKRYWYASADLLAKDTQLDRATVLAALGILTQAGRVIFDIKDRVYRLRELSGEPLPMSQLRFSNEREQKADNFINANLVTIDNIDTNNGNLTLTGSVMDNGYECKTSITLDSDQSLIAGHSNSDFYRENQLKKGPCEHMLALRRFHAKKEQTAPFSSASSTSNTLCSLDKENRDEAEINKVKNDEIINHNSEIEKTLFPKNKHELKRMVKADITRNGNECSLNHIDTSKITDMCELFRNSRFNGDISEWDVSNVKKMCNMFASSAFNGNLSNWNISKVGCICRMFGDSNFNGDISKWNTSSVYFMGSLFENNKAFNQEISSWDVSNVKDFSDTFHNSVFNQDISNWNVSNVGNMNCMFSGSVFNQDISQWDVSAVTDMSGMFAGSEFNQDISKWNVSNVRNMKTMFCNSQFSQDILQWDISSVLHITDMFKGSQFNQDISNWKIPNWMKKPN